MWRKNKRKRDGRVKDISIVFCYVINSVCAVVREDSGTFCFSSYGHSKRKQSHGKPRVPTVENHSLSGCDGLSVHLAWVSRRTAATFSGGAARLYATRDVVAGEDNLEVVGDERAHEAVGVANLVLRLVGLHHGEVSLRALGGLVGRTVLLPQRRRKLRLLLEDIKKHYKGAVLPGRPKKAQTPSAAKQKNTNLRKYQRIKISKYEENL